MPSTFISSLSYQTLVKSTDKILAYRVRRQIALDAKPLGVKPTARKYGCDPRTVRKYRDRFAAEGHDGLFDRSRAPKRCPHKTPPALEEEVVAARRRSGFGAVRLQHEFDLPVGESAIRRILRDRFHSPRRRKKHQKKNDLRAVKARYKAFTRFQMDTKHLSDIPAYWPQTQALGLPPFLYTIREERTGALFTAYADELSATWAELAARRFVEHLQAYGLDTSEVVLKTDNGSEFEGQVRAPRDFGFRAMVRQEFRAEHRFNPPACPNANPDVENAHERIEVEFFDRQVFRSRAHFLWTAET